MYMKLKDGKSKVVTLSYDDGVVQDKRFMKILDQHGLKCTFNINSGRYLPEDVTRDVYYGRMKCSEAQQLYINSGHEIGVHTLNHPFLDRLKTPEILVEVLEDRKNLEQQFGVLVRGMAYPNGKYNDAVIDVLRQCGICYSRTVQSTEDFQFPVNWLAWHPTCRHQNSRLMELAKKFAEEPLRYKNQNRMFYLWGHTYEFDDFDNWNVIEEFASYIGGREDIWYATNIEIYDYVQAYEGLQVSVDNTIIHNPSAVDVWFMQDGVIHCVRGGETLRF